MGFTLYVMKWGDCSRQNITKQKFERTNDGVRHKIDLCCQQLAKGDQSNEDLSGFGKLITGPIIYSLIYPNAPFSFRLVSH